MEQKKTMRDKNMIAKIVAENAQRLLTFSAEHNPITGEGCLGGRTILHLEDYQFPMQLIPKIRSDESINIGGMHHCVPPMESFLEKQNYE